MENTEIMNNETVTAAMEEIVPVSSGNGWAVVGKVMTVVGAIYGGYKLVTKFMSKKKEQKEAVAVECYDSEDECIEVEVND